jgi:hypothetical protein
VCLSYLQLGEEVMTDAQHHHNELAALRRHHAEDIQSIAKALGIDDNKAPPHELAAQIRVLRQERDTIQRLLDREQSQHREQIRWRACDQRRLAQILGLDPESPANTIPTMMDAVQRLAEDARLWRQSQRKR